LDDVLHPPSGNTLSNGWKHGFQWVETKLLMSGNNLGHKYLLPPLGRAEGGSTLHHNPLLINVLYNSVNIFLRCVLLYIPGKK